MSKHYLVKPFSSLTFGAAAANDFYKAGRQPDLWQWWWIRVLYSDYSDADTSQALNLADLADTLVAAGSPRTSGAIPDDALFGYWCADLKQVFAGGTIATATVILGYSGDDNGYLTSTNVFTGATLGRKRTAAAALWTPQPLAGDPLLQLDTTVGNISTATTGAIDIFARFTLDPDAISFG
jgi:hypothetical protein